MGFESDMRDLTLPASCLVYLFGDLFVDRRRLPWGREHLAWREVRYVNKRRLGVSVFMATFINLAETSRITLAMGRRPDEGFIMGKMMGTVRDTVWVRRGADEENADGILEAHILDQLDGRIAAYLVMKELFAFGVTPWDVALGTVKKDLVQRGYLSVMEGGDWFSGTPRIAPNVELIRGVESEARQLRELLEAFEKGQPDLHGGLQEEVESAFRSERDRFR